MNVALTFADGSQRGVHLPADLQPLTIVPAAAETTRTTIGQATTRAQAIALALGAPEFQRR
jgi:hypothetical protein